jgi:O-antigen/teichoic acid export membrane protein
MKRNVLQGKFGKNVVLITSGAAVAQIINIALSPIITRLYTPDEYGIISVFTAVIASLGFVGSFNFEMGIPIAADDKTAFKVLTLSTITLIISTLLLSTILGLFGVELLHLLDGVELINYIYLIPLGLLLKGLYNILIQWAYRSKDFKSITKTKFGQSFSQNFISILMGILGTGPIGLIIGKILGQSAGITTLTYPLIKNRKQIFDNFNLKELSSVAYRYKEFPLYTTPRRYLGDITISLPVLFITSLYGSGVVGFFGLANSVIQLPMNIIGTSISNVYYAECASLRNTNPLRIKELSDKLLKVLVIIGIVPLGILIIFGPQLFSFVFGSEWLDAGNYARLLSVSIFFRFIFKPISNIFDIFEKQKVAFWLNILRVALVFITFLISRALELNSYWYVGIYSISMAVIYLLQYLLARSIILSEYSGV